MTADAALDAKQRAAVDAAQVAVRSRGYWTTVALRIRDDKVTIVCGIVLLLIILSAVFADLVALADPYKASMLKRLKPIGTPGHPLGADEMGARHAEPPHPRRAAFALHGDQPHRLRARHRG